MRSGKVQTLRPEDAKALASQSYMDSATPSVQTSVTARYGNVSATAQVNGASAQYFRVRGLKLAEGSFFDNGRGRAAWTRASSSIRTRASSSWW